MIMHILKQRLAAQTHYLKLSYDNLLFLISGFDNITENETPIVLAATCFFIQYNGI